MAYFLLFVIGMCVGMFILYTSMVFPRIYDSIEKLAHQSKLIDELLSQILVKCHADRILLFQVKNGEYFESGMPLMKLVPTNEAYNKGFRPVKHCIKGVPFQYWGRVISFIIVNEIVTLSESNQYEGFEESESALKKRGMNSGVYFKLCKNTIFGKKMSAILCIEWQSQNPPFDADFALKELVDEILLLTRYINNYTDDKIDLEKSKKLEFI